MRGLKIMAILVLVSAGAALAQAQHQVFADGFMGPENLAFDGRGSLYVSDTNHLWRVDDKGKVEQVYERDPEKDGISLGGVSLGPGGRIYFSVGNRIMVLDPGSGSAEELVAGFDFANGNCLNDAGDLFIADSNAKVLYAVPAGTRELKVLKPDPGWINGLVWSREDNTLYFTISAPGRVGGYRLGPGPSIMEEVTITRFTLGGLDDLTMDAEGCFYVCMWLNGKVVKVTPGGERELLLKKLDGPSALAFGRREDDKDRLYICIKGGDAGFKGTKVIKVANRTEGYRLPFVP